MRIRPISADEIAAFAALTPFSGHHQPIQAYLEDMFARGFLRPELCFVAEQAERLLGRLAYWTHPKSGTPTDLFLFDIPWERPDHILIGTQLVLETLPLVRNLGATALGYVVDTPAQTPQWQDFPMQRHHLLLTLGFQVVRQTNRFAYDVSIAPPIISERLMLKSLAEVGIDAFVAAIEQVSIETRDQLIQQQRASDGSVQAAHEMVHILQGMTYEPAWWQLAYTRDEALVGLVMPTANASSGTIGYIGVVPQQRGHGYSHDLLVQGTVTLCRAGSASIRADTDVANVPMAKAFYRAGYTNVGRRQAYQLI